MRTNPSFDRARLFQFANALRERRRQLQHLIENAGKEARELAHAGPCDAIDVSCFSSSKESLFAHSSQNRRQLRLVEMALTRIQDGNFGLNVRGDLSAMICRIQFGCLPRQVTHEALLNA
jgi:RNA polymerase-binding transcription factor DksA